MSVFTNNLKKLLKQHNTTYAALSRELGIGKNGLKYWENAGNLPSGEILLKIADYFGTTVSILTGQSEAAQALTEEELELIEAYRQLEKSGKRQILGKVYELLDGQSVPKSGNEITPPDISMVSTVLDRGIKK